MALAGHRLGVIEGLAQHAVPVAVVALEDAQLVAALLHAHHAADAGGPVGAVILKGAGGQGRLKVIAGPAAGLEEVIDGVGLVAVGDDGGIADGQHRVVNDKMGVFHLFGVSGQSLDAALDGAEHPIAAVGAAAHDEIGHHGLLAVGRKTDADAAAGILVAGQIFIQIPFHSNTSIINERECFSGSRRCRSWPPPGAAASIPPAPSPGAAGSRGCRRAGCPPLSGEGWARHRIPHSQSARWRR